MSRTDSLGSTGQSKRARTRKSSWDKFVGYMDRVARVAIEELKLGLNDFSNQARASYRERHAIIIGARIKAPARRED